MIQVTTTSQTSLAAGIKGLIYGPPGVGKTCLAATAPAPIILSAESGLLSLRWANLPVIVIKSLEDLQQARQWCQQSHEASNFYTIYLDSLSEIAEAVVLDGKSRHRDPRKAYGEVLDKMMSEVKAFKNIYGKAVIMTAKMEPFKDGMSGAIKYGPSMPGTKLGPLLPYEFDEVFVMGIGQDPATKNNFRFLQTQPDLQYTAKDRSGALEPYETPDLTHVFNKILGV